MANLLWLMFAVQSLARAAGDTLALFLWLLQCERAPRLYYLTHNEVVRL